MPAFCRFYGLTPAEFRHLRLSDFSAMSRYIEEASKNG